ncbi:DUF6036 family nucleotidyltransferase [Phenylobacterium koreense]|uniref:DUF6036 domain-containing protein n=1 Tax=Phenylobacterium koreense TaxID=266125 RepID=A0ABV2ELW8_9CAUL
MKRQDLDHILRAAGDLTGHTEFVLVGSNAIFAWHDKVPSPMMLSREADLYAADVSDEEAEEIADRLEDIGQLSNFDDTHGYYVDGVGPQTAVLPPEWRARSKKYRSNATNGVTAIVPHPQDIAASKLYAGREKDHDWVSAALQAGFVDAASLAEVIRNWGELAEDRRQHMLQAIVRLRRER